jgi:O-antigen/teichoic acid export membrane protein
MALRGLLALGALAAVTALSGSLFAGILAMAGARALVLLAYDGRAVMRTGEGCLRPLWERERLWRLASLALPLGVVMGLGSLQMNIPRYVIEANYGERQLGLFFAMFHLIAAGTLVVGALGQTASPRLARYFAEGDLRAFWRLLALLLLLALALSCAGFLLALVAGRPILAALYAPEYAARFDVFLWIVAGSSTCFCAAFLGCAVTAMRAFDRLLLPYGAATAATAVVAFLLIPGYGLIGAAWTFGLGGLATCAAPTYILLTSRPLRGAEAPPAGER